MFLAKKTWLVISTVAVAASVSLTSTGANAATPGDQPLAPVGQTATEALNARSSAIPIQPLADPQTGQADMASRAAATSEYSRTCDRGYGTEAWNVQDAIDCAGTVTYYYAGENQGSLNMAAFIASQPPRTTLSEAYDAAQAWCSDNSLTCTVGVAFFVAGVQVLMGGIASA